MARRVGSLATVSLAALLALPVKAGTPTAGELAERNVEARGGAAAIRALASLRLTGKVVYGGDDWSMEMTWTRLVRRPGMIRTETSSQGMTAIQAWDGVEAWKVSPFGGRRDPERIPPDAARELVLEADLDGPLLGWKEKGGTLVSLGVEDVDGTPAHKLQVTRADGTVEVVYLDPDRFLEFRVETRTRIRGAEVIVERDLGNYEQVAGVWIPFAIEAGEKGAPRSTRISVERAEPGLALDPALFRFPVEGAVVAAPPPATSPRPAPSRAPARATPGPVRVDSGVISGLGARNIGSAAMSGRIAAIAAHGEGGKTTVFVGAASGGVWKSEDGGTTFRPVFDRQPVQSIGAIAIDPRNPRNVWVGTGEAWTRNSVSIGDGIYRSTDGGESWTHAGLPASERVARIVGRSARLGDGLGLRAGQALERLAGPGPLPDLRRRPVLGARAPRDEPLDRLHQPLARPEGARHGPGRHLGLPPAGLDLPVRRRRPDGAVRAAACSGPWTAAGPGTRFAPGAAGLPPKPWGRVEVVLAPSDSRVVYAFVESTAAGLYRSADGGRTWEARDRSFDMVWRPFYFARLVVDPVNPDRIFKTDLNLIVSEDGGRSFANASGRSHGDWHDLWIDPRNPKHVIGGDDGGLWMSRDGGSRWWKGDQPPDVAVLPRERRRPGPVPRLRRAPGQRLVVRDRRASPGPSPPPPGTVVPRERRLLGLRRSHRSGRRLCGRTRAAT